MRKRLTLLTIGMVALGAGCGESASSLSGVDALIRVTGGQFVPGAMPAATDGLMVLGVDSANNSVRPGQGTKVISGRLEKGAPSVAIGFEGDVGYWILPASVPDPNGLPGTAGLLFNSNAGFSPALTPGKHSLVFRAVDDLGRFGPPNPLVLTAQATLPDGDLVISLSWDTQSDLDLHVVTPDAKEVWSRKISTYKPPSGQMPDPDQLATAGVLDHDSNSQCVIDGRRMENVIWQRSAPSGHYIVRVDAYSLCGEAAARWRLEARLGVNSQSAPEGQLIGSASGIMLDVDTRFPHVEGAGALALEFDLQ